MAALKSEPLFTETNMDEPSLVVAPSELAEVVADIKSTEFSPYLEHWVEDYEKVGQRGRFLWQWCIKGLNLTTLPSVPAKLRDHVIETKMLSILYGTLIDDIADREQDREMLEMAIRLGTDEWLLDRLSMWNGRRKDYLEMIARFWEELGIAREIFWHAQRMGRIGNMLTTWEREVLDRDFTSGVFAHSLARGILAPADLRSLPAYEIMAMLENAECHAHFIRDWRTNRDEIARKST